MKKNTYFFLIISRSVFLRVRNVWDKSCRENQNTHFVLNCIFSRKSWCLWDTYLLTPRSRVLLEKLTGLQLVKKLPTFYGNRRFITAFTNARHLSLSWASLIQSTSSHPTSWRSILILSSHLSLGLRSGLLPSGFPTKSLYTPLPSTRATCPAHLILFDFTILTILGEECCLGDNV